MFVHRVCPSSLSIQFVHPACPSSFFIQFVHPITSSSCPSDSITGYRTESWRSARSFLTLSSCSAWTMVRHGTVWPPTSRSGQRSSESYSGPGKTLMVVGDLTKALSYFLCGISCFYKEVVVPPPCSFSK